MKKLDNAKSQINRDVFKRLRGKTARARDKRISDTLKQVHKPYHSRPVENTVSDAGTILFDLSQNQESMTQDLTEFQRNKMEEWRKFSEKHPWSWKTELRNNWLYAVSFIALLIGVITL